MNKATIGFAIGVFGILGNLIVNAHMAREKTKNLRLERELTQKEHDIKMRTYRANSEAAVSA